MDQIDLDSIDVDGALAESSAVAREAIDTGDTRSSFLRKGRLPVARRCPAAPSSAR